MAVTPTSELLTPPVSQTELDAVNKNQSFATELIKEPKNENLTHSTEHQTTSHVTIKYEIPNVTPVSIRSGALATTPTPCLQDNLRQPKFKFIPNVRIPPPVASVSSFGKSKSELLHPLDVGAVLAHSLSLKNMKLPSRPDIYSRRCANPGGKISSNSYPSKIQQKHSAQFHPNGRRKNKKKSINLFELSWAEGKNGASCYTPITLPFIDATEDDDFHHDEKIIGSDTTSNGSSMSLTKSKRPSVKHVDESNRNAAALFNPDPNLEEFGTTQWFLVQFPDVLPAIDKFAIHHQKNTPEKPKTSQQHIDTANQDTYCPCSFDGLPEGRLGTLHLHKSGRVVLHIGDHRFDVDQGSDCTFSQEVVCLTGDDAELMFLGQCTKRIVVTPDLHHYVTS